MIAGCLPGLTGPMRSAARLPVTRMRDALTAAMIITVPGWSALQEMLATGGVADAANIEQVMQAWTDAYLTTPHGQPVKLGTG